MPPSFFSSLHALDKVGALAFYSFDLIFGGWDVFGNLGDGLISLRFQLDGAKCS